MPGADYTVLITDPSLNVVGDPIVNWSSINVTQRFNDVGSGEVVVPAYGWILDQVEDGCRVVVIRNGEILLSGPVEEDLEERSDDGENAGIGKLTLTFGDDAAQLMARCVYPDPAHTPDAQATSSWTFSGNAEVGMRTVVNVQGGPGALAPRRVPGLVLGTLVGVGSNISVKATRMQMLGDLLRSMALTGGNLGYRVVQVGNQLQFQVYAPTNKSGTIRFGFGLGNLRYLSRKRTAPTATVAIVGGQGDGGDAYMIERVNTIDSAAFGRYETLVARPGSGPLQGLQDDGDEALGQAAATTQMTANVSDLPDQHYGDYRLGDIVAIEDRVGTQVTDIIRSINFEVTAASNEYVSATIGSQAANPDPRWIKRLDAIDVRLGRIERTVVPIAS